MNNIKIRVIATFIIVFLMISSAKSEEYINVDVCFQSTFPEIHGFAYRNVAFDLESDYYIRPSGPGSFNWGGWIIKRIDPEPEIYPGADTLWVSRVDTFSNFFDSTAGMEREIFDGEVSFLFGFTGTYIFRNGWAWNLPYQLSQEEFWEWLEGPNGVYGEDVVHFDFGVPDAEFHYTSLCPTDWLPVIEGYIDSTGQPNYDDFKVLMKSVFTSRRAEQTYRIRWVLQNISWYDQMAMNYPNPGVPESPPTAPNPFVADLKILNQYNDNLPIPLSCSWDSTRRAFYGDTEDPVATGDTLQAVVTCYDFGAHGDILLEAFSEESNMWYILSKHVEKDSQCVSQSTIPIDEDGNMKDKLADHWEELMLLHPHCPDSIDSIEQIIRIDDYDWYIPGFLPLNNGDLLTTFEEYRGFYCKGIHTRTVPWDRDFFIYSNLDSTCLNTGIGYADLIGPDLCHWIDSTEMKSYSEPDTSSPLDEILRSVNWYDDRIDSTVNCPSAIFLENPTMHPLQDTLTLGKTWWYCDSATYYHIPKNTTLGYLYSKRIRYQTPWNYDTTTVDPVDTLWQDWVSGHEIGHMVNMRESQSDSSIMNNHVIDWRNPPHIYEQEDLDYFLIKPP